jgi:CRISPR-associated protein (TIGR02584 family)
MPQPADPASYPHRTLLAVVGLTPQIVTETLYALIVRSNPPFIPTRIEILTTAEGHRRAIDTLLDPSTGAFASFCRDYNLPALSDALPAHAVLAMPGVNQPLEDIRTVADSGAAADAIVARIRTHTENPDTALHVSIAGGRKTMGFLAGHALSLLGRSQDRLSHVLVDDRFLTLPDFFYPPPQPRLLRGRSGCPMSTQDAGVTLVEIPFLRLRGQLPPAVLDAGRSYTETVALAQAALEPTLQINMHHRIARFGGLPIRLPPAEFAWLTWMATRRCNPSLPHDGALHWTEADPDEILHYYAMTVQPPLVVRARKAMAGEYMRAVFEQRTAKVNKLVRDGLGPAAGSYILRSDRCRPTSRTGLRLHPDSIEITL